MPTGSISNVLVVCHGNLCRSPFAAGLLAARRSDLSVRSAGLAAGDSDPADRAALRVSRQFGVELDAHRTRLLNLEDLGWSDLILCMEGHQAVRIGRTGREYLLKTRLLGDFLPIPPHLIKDPWGCSDEVYVETFERISNALERLSKVVEKQ
jgi:protein-tyrosine phosphatase